jgi:stage III sporulation protein SpoIIIAA
VTGVQDYEFMKTEIIGRPQVGKTALFRILTKAHGLVAIQILRQARIPKYQVAGGQ